MTEAEKDPNIEKALSDALAKDETKEKQEQSADQKRLELNTFIRKREEGLLPDSKKIIGLYVPIVQEIQQVINTEKADNPDSLEAAYQTLREIAGQIGINLQPFFEKEKYQDFQAKFLHIFQEIKSFEERTESWIKSGGHLKENRAIAVRQRFLELRDLLSEMFEASLNESDKQMYKELPREILTEMRELELKFQKNN